MPSESEDYLVRQAIEHDRAAFTSLYESSIDKVYRHVYYRVSDQDESQDITQEVFVRAWKSIDRYKNTGAPFVCWLIKIATNLITDYYRNRQKLVKRDETLSKDLILSQNDLEDQAEIYFNAFYRRIKL
jgi:RNA polymerase sigma factor (sigma-70 family)